MFDFERRIFPPSTSVGMSDLLEQSHSPQIPAAERLHDKRMEINSTGSTVLVVSADFGRLPQLDGGIGGGVDAMEDGVLDGGRIPENEDKEIVARFRFLLLIAASRIDIVH